MPISIRFVLPALWTALVAPGLLPGQAAAPVPRKYIGPPTVAEITAGDLMTRVYKFADDSMMGRQVGTPYNDMGTAYIESEVRRLGLQPAGDNGTFFQKIPLYSRTLDSASTISVGGSTFTAGTDFVATAPGFTRDVSNATVVFVGPWVDTTKNIPADSARGKVLVFLPGGLAPGSDVQKFVSSNGYAQWLAMRSVAAANVLVSGEALTPNQLRAAFGSTATSFLQDSVPLSLTVTRSVAEAMLGAAQSSWANRMAGKPLTTSVRFTDTPKPGRNVVAILPGSDPRLRRQYVAIGAHNDHIGVRPQGPVDHDSVKAFMQVVRPQGADSDPRQPTAEEAARVKAILDSLRAVSAPRPDSIYNGADDDGSGSMTVLEIAEQFAKGREKPRRSILFVWHTGEEAGLWGASHFTAHPTVPRDSIIGQLNMDMVGRGRVTEVKYGGPASVQMLGARRLSREFGDIIDSVNAVREEVMAIDRSWDVPSNPMNRFCRSDQVNYVRRNVPVVYLSLGYAQDYHQVTDEPQYIDYEHSARLGRFVFDVMMAIAQRKDRPMIAGPDPAYPSC